MKKYELFQSHENRPQKADFSKANSKPNPLNAIKLTSL